MTFRFVREGQDSEALNRALLKAVHDDGRIFISSTLLDGRFTLRVAILHFRTHKQELDYLLDLLRRASAKPGEIQFPGKS